MPSGLAGWTRQLEDSPLMADALELLRLSHLNAIVDGDTLGVLAIPPEHNHGLRFEFSEVG